MLEEYGRKILSEIFIFLQIIWLHWSEARQRDLSDSFVLSGTSAKFSITFRFGLEGHEGYFDTILLRLLVLYLVRQEKYLEKHSRQI